MVKFYAPWCGHCKAMQPDYSKLAEKMKATENGVAIAKVDATVEEGLSERFKIEGYPALKFFKNGKPVEYEGERTEEAMFEWLKKKMGPGADLLETEDELKELRKRHEVVIVLYVPEDIDEKEEAVKEFMEVASNYDTVPFYYSHNDYLRGSEDGHPFVLMVYRDFDEGKKMMVSKNPIEKKNMINFINTFRFRVVMPFDETAAKRIFATQSPAMFLMTDDDTHPSTEVFRYFAKENAGKILYSLSPISEGLGSRLSEFLGVTTADSPTVRMIRFVGNDMKKYVVDDLTNEGLESALADFTDDKLTPFYKSEPVPEKNDEAVKVVVGKNFDEMVIENDKFVLLEAYAPWCGHCQQLEPVYKEFAEKMKSEENLVVAKIDASANEHDMLKVEGFPTIFLFKPGKKDMPVVFSGDRTVEGFEEYVRKEMGEESPAEGGEL